MSGHHKWRDLKHKNPIVNGQARARAHKLYNRPWWQLVRWWDTASPFYFFHEMWAGPEYRPWWKFPFDYISWLWRWSNRNVDKWNRRHGG